MPKIERLDEKKNFYHNLLAGHFHKDLIRVILEESGYEVYPYGYESFLTPLKIKFEKREIKQTEISKKIRATPDLLVYNPEDRTVELLEVKSTRWDWTDNVLIDALPRYQMYWKYSTLVMVLPSGHFFYAQKVNKLKQKTENLFDLNEEFAWFEKVFSKVNLDTLYSYKRQIIDFWSRPRKHYNPLETTLDHFNLYHLIQDNCNRSVQCSIDRLFQEQNARNLISRKAFNKAIETLVENGKIIKDGTKIRLS